MLKIKKPKNVRMYKWTLYRKLALCIFCSMLVSLACGIGILYGRVYSGMVSMNNDLNENNLVGTRNNINQLVRSVENEVTITFLNKEFRSLIMDSDKTFDDFEFYNTTNSLAGRSMISMNYVRHISILKTNGANYYTKIPALGLGFKNYDDCKEQLLDKLNKLISWNGIAGWYSSVTNPSEDPVATCFLHAREIYDVSVQEPVAVMLIYLDESVVCGLYDFFGKGSFMMDKDGTIVSSMDKERIGTSIQNTNLFQEVIASKKETISGEYNEKSVKKPFSCTYLPSLACYIVAVPDYNVFSNIQKTILINALYMMMFGTIISFFLAIMLARKMASPIANLKFAMAQVRNGRLDTRFSGSNTDEIAYLGTSFNILMDTIENYIKDIKENEEEKRHSELRLLQAQINPHLLYNTLDSALYLLSKNEVDKACSSIEALSEFFKLSLSKGRVFVTIETELYHVRQYMEIQRLCRDKDITLKVIAEERLLKKEIVKMTLQPIVENSYLHAFTGEIYTGSIVVEITEEKEYIIITVMDDGMGMDEKELSEVKELLLNPKESRQGFGLWNVNQRLKNCYGADCGLKIDSEFGEFTKVTVTILDKKGETDV